MTTDPATPPPAEDSAYPELSQARAVALGLLDRILTRRATMDQAFDDSRDFPALPVRDRAFVRMIVTTTLRRLGQIDDLIARAQDKKSDGKPAPQPPLLHHLLRMGAAQMMFMNVPDHAAVNTTVHLADISGLSRQKGFVNAILRRLGREGRDWLALQDEARLNIPEWLLKSWIDDYGLKDAATIAQASLTEAPLDLTVKDPAQRGHWAQILEAAILPTGSLRRASGGNIVDLPGYADGMWWVQDAAAALPVRLLGNVEGMVVADLCAAPGGKSAQLAAAGAQVIAVDRSTGRLRRLEENIRRLRLDRAVQSEAADAGAWRPKGPVNAILLDAPCSATGTIRRHPDLLHLKNPAELARLMEIQAALLNHAASLLPPGGMLIYCTCSLQKSEGEWQVEKLLKHRKFMRRLPVRPEEIGGLSDLITPDGDLRVFPYHLAAHGGMDGFYIARLVREA